jgi:rRNA metabolism SBDS family protein
MSKSQTVKYKKGKMSFEILTKDGSVRKYVDGRLGWNNVLAADVIFTNSKKGNIAKSKDLISTFGTDDVDECAKRIIAEGDAQVSATERKEDMAAYTRKVLGYLHKTYIDQLGRPHPMIRLESVLVESKVRLDPSGNHEKQAEEIVKKMQGKLVFKKGTADYTLSMSHQYAKKCTGIVYKFSLSFKESWDAEGCTWKISVSPGDFDRFVIELNKITSGDYMLECGHVKQSISESKEDSEPKTKRGKKKKKNHRRK